MDESEMVRRFKLPDDLMKDWQILLRYIADMLNVKISFITRIIDDDLEMFVVSQDDKKNPKYSTGSKMKIYGTFCEQTMQHNQKPHIVPDGRKDPQYMDAKDFSSGYISYLGFPVRFPSGELFGTLCVEHSEPRDYSESHIKLLETCRNLIETHIALSLDKEASLRMGSNEMQGKDVESNETEPVCAHCHKIRLKDQEWITLEKWLLEREIVKFTHGICPECMKRFYDI